MFGTTATGKGFFDFGTEHILQSGIPPAYPLPFYNYTRLGVPFYHYRNDWVKAGSDFNYTKKDGTPAKIGDKVAGWYNTYLSPGEGTAVVAQDFNGENWFGKDGYPTLVQKQYGPQVYRGLRFHGSEYLQIDGSIVADAYSLPEALFTTEGTGLMSGPYEDTGASFLVVFDQEWHAPEYGGNASNQHHKMIETLLHSKQPHVYGSTPSPIPTGYTWPTTENHGLVWMLNGDSYCADNELGCCGPVNIFCPHVMMWGPDGAVLGSAGDPLVARVVPPPNSPYSRGAWKHFNFEAWEGQDDDGQALWWVEPELTSMYSWKLPGFQAVLLEFDNTESVTFDPADHTSTYGMAACTGPKVSVYAMGGGAKVSTIPDLFAAPPNTRIPWKDDDLTIPKLVSTTPAHVSEGKHTLWHSEHLFVGGSPPASAHVGWGGPTDKFGNGFKGVIYEVAMFEGKLTKEDKRILQESLLIRYGEAFKG